MAILFRYLKIFYRVYAARLGKDFTLPVLNQTFQVIGSVCFFILHFYSFSLLIKKFSFPGWTEPEMWILLFTFEIFTYLAFYLFWRGFNYTVRDINTGAFDLTLTKPIPSILLSFFRGGGFHNIFCSIFGLLFLIIELISFGLPVTLFSLILYFLSLCSSLWVMYCLGVSFISLNLRYGRLTATIGAVFQVQEAYKYPSTVYTKFSFFIWVAFSAASLLTTLPAAWLLSKSLDPKLIAVYFIVLILTTVISRLAWNSGLRYYSSASS
jgi:ABC-2 type transport system permease protein